ncbi:MAG: alpha/beta hydrolase [Alphaproteobacteria bacterium]|nr:alpha/beta hydrolase [Alphaproteobacteria bacterium]
MAPRYDYGLLSRKAPALAGDLAFRRFCVPRFSEYRTRDHPVLVARARYHLRDAKVTRLMTSVGEVATYELLPDLGTEGGLLGSILVVHGWTSEASFMSALAEPLRRSGFRVVLADCPAHGRSRGERTNLVACAQAMVQVADDFGPFNGIVAHSMGALAALMAGAGQRPLSHAVVFDKYCLIAAPNKFSEVTKRFADRLGVSVRARRQFERQLERISHMPMRAFSGERFLRIVQRPALVIHSTDDHEVPFHNAVEMTEFSKEATLLALEGLGHRRVLYAPPVVRAVVGFFRGGGDTP